MKVITNITFLLLLLTPILTNANYTPADSILLNCGSKSDDSDIDGRKWSGDSASKPLLTATKSSAATASSQDPSLPSPVPYMTATVFLAEATYKFKVSDTNRHWVRLHFYPSIYNNLNAANSFFNVTASGGVTLLRNFSADITATALSQAYLIKEYSLVPSNGTLSLTFIPYAKSFAFVNGIEIVSMPDIFSEGATMVGVNADVDLTSSALETKYRLNVGGQYIAPVNDTGLSRAWYDDSFYIYGASVGVTPSVDDRYAIQYPTKDSRYIAPEIVYMTARSMGPDKDVNINYNLTWVFQVDANFTYVVRMHFCEIVNSSYRVNSRVFDIYINNQTAESGADVIAWASKMYVPVYKDYAVYVSDTPGDDMLWVALHPSVESKPEFYDAILNGLEIFKVNDSTGNLGGPNPNPIPIPVQTDQPEGFGNKSGGRVKIIGGTAGGVAGVALAFVICVAVYQRKKKVVSSQSSGNSGWLPLYGNSHNTNTKSTISGKSTTSSHVSTMAASMCRHFSITEIKQGTRNFDESLVIGVGGFGKVYKGVVDGSMKVAIKRSNPSSEQGVNEFQTEIEMLSMLRHKHLVSLIGYCEEDGEMCLVYDFMAYGTLREHLYKTNNPPLSWKQRLEICIGAARGLHYLHTGAKYTIIHRDVKTTNILLDENFVAKVSDFGLSKTGPMINETHVSTVVKGSFGYLDPEYFRRQQLTEKSDVYSFGVVLFEVLCARPALNPSLPKEQVSLADWALHCQKKGILGDIVDPIIKETINPEVLKKFTEIAEKCLSDHGVQRPSMGDVLWTLEFVLQLTENSEVEGFSGGSIATYSTEAMSDDSCTVGHARAGSEAGSDAGMVFSQLVNPKGR